MAIVRALLGLSVVTAIAGMGCSPIHANLSFAAEARLLHETTLDDAPEGFAAPGDGVVKVMRTGQRTSGACSGALIGSRHVLTAAHCVLERDIHRELGTGWLAPGALHIELGGGYLPWGRLGVRAIDVCEGYERDAAHDLAVLVLGAPAPPDVDIHRIAFDVTDGNAVDVWGFGSSAAPRNVSGFGWSVALDRHGYGGAVGAGASVVSVPILAVPGDSGGPIIDRRTGAIVSVVSEGGDRRTQKEGQVNGPLLRTCAKTIATALAR